MNESYPNIQDGIPAADAALPDEHDRLKWFVMRDLKRCNARLPAYRLFKELGIEAFTPMVWKLSVRHGKRCREKVPFMQDLLFVHDTRHSIDSVVESYNTIQYRYVRGGYRIPMTVRDANMQRFIHAVESSESPRYYTPDEISSDMIGRKVRIIGGFLDGYEGYLQKLQGSRIKRLFIGLPNLLTASVEVQPEYILFL